MKSESVPTVKVLMVCMGNICRSPAAEGIMRHKIAEAGLSQIISVDSAGTLNYHAGELPDERMRIAARQRGFVLDMKARQVRTEDFATFDYILVMDDQNLRDIARFRPRTAHAAQLHKILDLVPGQQNRIVPDPYYGTASDFEHVLDLLDDACDHLLARVVTEKQLAGLSEK